MRRILIAALAWLALGSAAFAQVCPGGSTCATLDSYLGAHLTLGGPMTTGGALTTTGIGATTLAFPATAQTFTFPSAADTLVGRASTDTLTNKTLTSPTVNGATLTGTLAGTPTFSGNLTFSGIPIFSGVLTGTIASGGNLGLDVNGNLVKATVSGGGGTPGGTSGQIQYNNAGAFGGVTLTAGTPNISLSGTANATISTTVPINAPTDGGTHSYTVQASDLTKCVELAATFTTLVVPQATGSFGSGSSFCVITKSAITATSTTSTVNGIAGATGLKLGANAAHSFASDGTNWQVAIGVPTPTTQDGSTFLKNDGTYGTPAGSGTLTTVTDGTTSVANGTTITFSGATVSNVSGNPTVTVSGGGPYTQLATQTVSAGTSLTLTGLDTGSKAIVTVQCYGLQASAGSLAFKIATNGTVRSASYAESDQFFRVGASASNGFEDGTATQMLSATSVPSSGQSDAIIFVIDANSQDKITTFNGTIYSTSAVAYLNLKGTATYTGDALALTGFSVAPASGTMNGTCTAIGSN